MGELAHGPWERLAGRYTRERELGRGGMAVVWNLLRTHPRFQKLVEGTA